MSRSSLLASYRSPARITALLEYKRARVLDSQALQIMVGDP